MRKNKFTIGLPKETKTPVDNRVIFSPDQAAEIMSKYPMIEIIVESSAVRCFPDRQYQDMGIQVVDNLTSVDCDIIIGIKEQELTHIIPNRHYVFFGHFAKEQEYNRSLAKHLLSNKNTFTDHEYLVDNSNKRLCAFGRYAGIVGAYNALWGYGLKEKRYALSSPNSLGVVEKLLEAVKLINIEKLPNILFTGNGNVAKGCREFLTAIGYEETTIENYTGKKSCEAKPLFVNLLLKDLVQRKDGKPFSRTDFSNHPEEYVSCLLPKLEGFPVLIPCHFWGEKDPVYLNQEDLIKLSGKLKLVADITCDISGGFKCTVRSSTHDSPFYDYNPFSNKEEDAFSSPSNITIMAVDTLPNAVPVTSSVYFGSKYMELVIPGLLEENQESKEAINRATIIRDGHLTSRFSYLSSFVK